MTIEEALFAHLSTSGGITALVGTRIYPAALPAGPTLPAVTYFKVSDPPARAFGRRQWLRPRFQLSCWGGTYGEAKGVATAVKGALEGFAGVMGGAGGPRVRLVIVENELDLVDPPTGFHHTPVDFIIHYQEQ